MDIAQELKDAKQKQQENVNNLNQLRQQFQQQEQALLQAILRMDGRIEMLTELSKDGDKPQQ